MCSIFMVGKIKTFCKTFDYTLCKAVRIVDFDRSDTRFSVIRRYPHLPIAIPSVLLAVCYDCRLGDEWRTSFCWGFLSGAHVRTSRNKDPD